MKISVPVLLFTTAMLLSGCRGAVTDSAKDVKALKDNEVQWNADFASKDAARIAGHYADDAVFLVSGEKPTVGKDAITAEFKGMTSDPAFSLQLHTDKAIVAESGDLGFTQGTYSLTITNPVDKSVVHDVGSYLTVYRKANDGTWKAVSDVPVSSVPLPPSQSK